MEPVTDQQILPELDHDKEIQIATAASRTSSRWKNTTVTVASFAQRLGGVTRTPETVAEYHGMPRSDQDRVKDVGAFVGGVLKGGSRKKSAVANRQLITMDIDYATAGDIDKIKDVLKGVCYTLYTTHKHTSAKPRLRVIVYPDRPMLPDEYQPVARAVADRIGIEIVDDSTYDINRLFYWPSCPIDGEFVTHHNDAPFLGVDTVLQSYGADDAWKDASMWPRSSRETVAIDRMLKKQADPMLKTNIVGAFCRTMPLREAIAGMLGDVYKKEGGGRYTYLDGSTANGVVIYEGQWAYSNHATDPAHGMLLNAFDLVRVHKFGDLDERVRAGTPVHKLESFRAMEELARGVPGVKADMLSNNLELDVADFDMVVTASGETVAWVETLDMTTSGLIKPTWDNVAIIFAHDPEIKDKMRLNAFSSRIETASGGLWDDFDSYRIKKYIGERYKLDVADGKFQEVVAFQAEQRKYHPVQDYLLGLRWDGVPRVASVFVDYLGMPDTAYSREIAKCWFTAAVTRVFDPGAKFDHVPVLGGAQGIGKTTFVRTLAGGPWFGELHSFDPKIAVENILGKWIVEIAELAANNRSELEQQKTFLTGQSTVVRMAYARHPQEFFRQCVFMGTTNTEEYLKDSTGNRRWWPIDVGAKRIDIGKLKSERDQIWAEAFGVYYVSGYRLHLTEEIENEARDVQKNHQETDEWRGVVEEWIDTPGKMDRFTENTGFGPEEPRARVCVPEVLEDCLGLCGTIRRYDRLRITAILNQLEGWKKGSTGRFGTRFGTQKSWYKILPNVPF